MEEKIIKELQTLKASIDNDERLLRLSELEAKLAEDEEVKRLSKRLKKEEEAYSFALSTYGKNSEETKKAQLALFEAKKELDSLPLVKEYNEAYIAVRDLYMQIDDIIFSPFRRRVLKID